VSGGRLSFEPIARSPAHRYHAGLGARFVVEGRWEIPASYEHAEQEGRALRGGVAVADITARGKIDLRGEIDPVLSTLVQAATPTGSVVTIEGEGSGRMHVARLGGEWALILSEATAAGSCLASVEAARKADDTLVTDVTGLYAGFALGGPKVFELLSRLTALDLAGLGTGTCAATRVAETSGILVRRPSSDEIVELYVGSEFGRYAWETVLALGRGVGALPIGWDALRATGWW
jgi:glycine cleavage system aminomethyltransferase T